MSLPIQPLGLLRVHEKQIVRIPLDAIQPNPYQPRRIFDEEALSALALSIREVGLLQPITVRRAGGGFYEIIAGERRFRACRLAGVTHIDAIVQTAREQESAVFALIENLQRENLSYFEEAEGYLALMREHGLTQDDLALRLSKNQSTIANKLRLLKLPLRVRERLTAGCLTERHARALLRLPDEEAQMSVLETAIRRQLTVKRTEELVEKALCAPAPVKRSPRVTLRVSDPRLYLNAMRKLVEQMKQTGFAPVWKQERFDDRIEVTLVVPFK